MEPKLSMPSLGPEKSSVFHQQSHERGIGVSPSEVLESQQFKGPERLQEGERTEVDSTPILPPPIIFPQPPTPIVSDVSSTTNPSMAGAPLVASDDDLIEREWVDKAKKIIIDTKEDPYRREREVALLQSDYLKKRYGRELGASQ